MFNAVCCVVHDVCCVVHDVCCAADTDVPVPSLRCLRGRITDNPLHILLLHPVRHGTTLALALAVRARLLYI